MQLDIGMVFSSLIGLFLLMGVGWVSVKAKIVPPSASAPMSSLLLKVTLPCTIFSSLATREFDSAFLVDGVIIIVIGLVLFPLYAALSWGISKVLKVPAGRRGIWSFGATFCNNGFMGFPVALALFGEEGLALAVMFGVPFNLLVYTLGVRMVCADCGTDAQPVNLVRTLLSNINIALILSLIFYVGQIPLPEALMTPVTHLSNVTTPLSMFVTGMTLASGKGTELFRDKDAYTATGMRLIVVPLLTWAVMSLLPLSNPLIASIVLITMAMPAPSVTTILAETYNGNRGLAAKIVFLTSLFCMITLPLVAMFLLFPCYRPPGTAALFSPWRASVKAEALRVSLISKQKSLLPQGALAPDLSTLPAKSFRKFLHRQPDFADTTLCLQNATAGGI